MFLGCKRSNYIFLVFFIFISKNISHNHNLRFNLIFSSSSSFYYGITHYNSAKSLFFKVPIQIVASFLCLGSFGRWSQPHLGDENRLQF